MAKFCQGHNAIDELTAQYSCITILSLANNAVTSYVGYFLEPNLRGV